MATDNDALIATSVDDEPMSECPPHQDEEANEEGAEESSSEEESSDGESSDEDGATQGKNAHKRAKKGGRLRKYGGKEKELIKKYNRKHGERTMVGKSNRAKHGSSYLRLTTADEDQKAQTPDSVLGEITERYGKTLGWKGPLFDPCPAVHTTTKKGEKKRVDPKLSGIAEDFEWGKVNYVNPPYGQIKLWFPKAIQEQAKGKTSIFLIPFRPFTRYFVASMPNISWLEVIYYGVGFRGYSGKIPHPMCMVCFLGKGVKDQQSFHMTCSKKGEPQKKLHSYVPGSLKYKVAERTHTFVQMVPHPHAFDNATEICREYGMNNKQIDIMINSSNMTAAGYLDEEKIAKARKSWKDAYALLVPFYNYSVAFQNAMRDCSILAYSSPILCNYAGEGKCRFCSVLFVFCPVGNDKIFQKFIKDEKLNPFRMAFNYNGYLPSKEDMELAKMKKIQKEKGLGVHKKGSKTIKGKLKVKGAKKPKSAKKSAKKAKKPAKQSSAKKPAKASERAPPTATASPRSVAHVKAAVKGNIPEDYEAPEQRPKSIKARINACTKYVAARFKATGTLPSINTVRAGKFGVGRLVAEEIFAQVEKKFSRGKKRKGGDINRPNAKRSKISG